MKVLVTKTLTEAQLNLLNDFQVTVQPFIQITYGQHFNLQQSISNAVFTSVNSVKSVFEINLIQQSYFNEVYCVGLKTAELLTQFKIPVKFVAKNALELAEFLVNELKNNHIQEISWFCGNLKNDDLPTILAENQILITEYQVYQTKLTPHHFEEDFDYVMFYSPSAIQSYVKANNSLSITAICLGSTTASIAVNYFDHVYISELPSIENTIETLKEIAK